MSSTSSDRPLDGLKVLELGALIAGPFCAKTLGEFGAEVIKIEPPGEGDPLRKWRYLKDGTSLWWHVQSRNKKSIALDLRGAEGQAIARRLALAADIVVENFRPGTLEGWGLGYDALAAENPGLIMVRIHHQYRVPLAHQNAARVERTLHKASLSTGRKCAGSGGKPPEG